MNTIIRRPYRVARFGPDMNGYSRSLMERPILYVDEPAYALSLARRLSGAVGVRNAHGFLFYYTNGKRPA